MSFSPKICPHFDCPSRHSSPPKFHRKGFFKIKRLNQRVRQFQCTSCKKCCSSRTFQPDYRHKKMDLNLSLARLLVEGNSLRACARLLGMTYKNTYLKFVWMRKLLELKQGKLRFRATKLQFDELETIHHTKCKPLSIALVVSEQDEILSALVAEMPATGRLAAISVKKYGPRIDQRSEKIQEALVLAKSRLESPVLKIESDAKPGYRKLVKTVFGDSVVYQQFIRPERVRIQERLHEKKQKRRFDPLFAVNHQCAWLRAQIRRLARRSWCTTKKVENLQLHLDLLIHMQNQIKN